jgi:hypothetical protein
MSQCSDYGRVPAVLALLALTFAAAAQDTTEPDEVEEIIVYGEKNLLALRTVFRETEDQFLTKFNELNTDPMLEIECKMERRLDADRRSWRRNRVCTPRFYRKLEARSNADMMDTATLRGSSPAGVTPMQPRFEQQREEMNRRLATEMLTLMSENPDLLEAYQAMAAAKAEYESFQDDRRQKRSGGDDE